MVLLWTDKLGRDASYGEKSLVVFLVNLCCSEVLFGNHLSLGNGFADEWLFLGVLKARADCEGLVLSIARSSSSDTLIGMK